MQTSSPAPRAATVLITRTHQRNTTLPTAGDLFVRKVDLNRQAVNAVFPSRRPRTVTPERHAHIEDSERIRLAVRRSADAQ
jgi:hypothetical protein